MANQGHRISTARLAAIATGVITRPDAGRQVRFHQALLAARRTWLRDALAETLAQLDPTEISDEIATVAPKDARSILATAGIRDEYVFPTVVVLKKRPALLGYYRLLLGLPRKSFYAGGSGRSLFQSMETADKLGKRQEEALPELVAVMCEALAELVRLVSPTVTQRDLDELPLLTLGAQLQGGNNVAIGQEGTRAVFLSIRSIVEKQLESETDTELVVRNAAGRLIRIRLAADPDVRVGEEMGSDGSTSYKVAIEIKAGTDASNAYNRAGEAEKSHQAAERAGARDFWTIIAKKGADSDKLQGGSPRTRSWFDVSQVLAREGPDWDEFKRRIIEVTGIPNPTT